MGWTLEANYSGNATIQKPVAIHRSPTELRCSLVFALDDQEATKFFLDSRSEILDKRSRAAREDLERTPEIVRMSEARAALIQKLKSASALRREISELQTESKDAAAAGDDKQLRDISRKINDCKESLQAIEQVIPRFTSEFETCRMAAIAVCRIYNPPVFEQLAEQRTAIVNKINSAVSALIAELAANQIGFESVFADASHFEANLVAIFCPPVSAALLK